MQRLILPVFLALQAAAFSSPIPYAQNRAPLQPVPYLPLPLGSVQAQGWLKIQLEFQRDGLTGHLPELLPDVGPASGWRGGEGENWEKGPYYLKGLVPLAWILDDPQLKKNAQVWIDWTLGSQEKNGFFGPKKNNDWWPRMVMTHVLREYADATNDARVVPFLTHYYTHMRETLPDRPLEHWGKSRAGDEVETVYWLYNRTGEKALLDLAALLRKQAYPWTDIFIRNRFLEFGEDFQPKHNVNVPQAMKTPPLFWLQTKAKEDREALRAGLAHLNHEHGTPLDINTGTEFLAGQSTTQGIETCSIVEKMLSLETAVRILADPALGDSLETLAFNALPTSLTKNFKQQIYYTIPNNVRAVQGGFGFNQDYGNGTTPDVPSGFPCCIYNMHMGWPKFVQNCWAATPKGGLAAVAYAPVRVQTHVGGKTAVSATVEVQTVYPFDDRIILKIDPKEAVEFPLDLRIPTWCDTPAVRINGEPQKGVRPGTFHRLTRRWKPGDTVALHFPMKIRAREGANRSVSISRGSLVYSLRIKEEWKTVTPRPDGFDALTLEPRTPWNYALVLDPANVSESFQFENSDVPLNPFDPEKTPVRLTAHAKRLPQWTLNWHGNAAFDPPASPVASDSPAETVTLVPVGAQMLRLLSFPWIGTPAPPPVRFEADFSRNGLKQWIPYGGGWFVQDGALRTTVSNANSGPTLGVKAVAMGTEGFSDFTYEADVTVGPEDQAGLIFRINKPGIGVDAYAGYYAGLSAKKGEILLGRADNGWKLLASAPTPIAANQPHHLRIIAQGADIAVYLNGSATPALRVKDATFRSGSLGVRHFSEERTKIRTSFSNLKAKAF
jgi:hypothetical protein